ncbi:MAG: helix-turn-helix domain-containing protein [Bacteroidetes bacterium]|nr:helix-turn-helix domain-containing protein [Bacteroidota bacterium]MCL2302169.1 helix-turn-helix domain-containing protein [Lentimicrobiaceae bacterium]
MIDLTKNINALIKEKGETQDFIASKLGIKQGTLSQKIGQNDKIKYKTLLDISNILGIRVIDIITYPDVYAPVKQSCESCKQFRLEVKHLSEYIEILKENKSGKAT